MADDMRVIGNHHAEVRDNLLSLFSAFAIAAVRGREQDVAKFGTQPT